MNSVSPPRLLASYLSPSSSVAPIHGPTARREGAGHGPAYLEPEPDGDHRGDAVGEAEHHAIGEDGAGLVAALAPEASNPAGHKAAASEGGTGDHERSPSRSVSVQVKTPFSPCWMGATRARGRPDEVDVGQLCEHDGVEFNTSHTPYRSKAWGLAAKPWTRAGLVSVGVIPGGAVLPGQTVRAVRPPIAATSVTAEWVVHPIAHARLQARSELRRTLEHFREQRDQLGREHKLLNDELFTRTRLETRELDLATKQLRAVIEEFERQQRATPWAKYGLAFMSGALFGVLLLLNG